MERRKLGRTGLEVSVLGYGAGAGLQASTYLISRYAGLKAFGAIFGLGGSANRVAAASSSHLGI